MMLIIRPREIAQALHFCIAGGRMGCRMWGMKNEMSKQVKNAKASRHIRLQSAIRELESLRSAAIASGHWAEVETLNSQIDRHENEIGLLSA